MAKQFPELAIDQLRAYVDPESLPFDSTESLEALEKKVVGQERGVDAIKFGMGMKEYGYNIYIAGPSKAGLTYIAKTFIKDQAKQEPVPPDWCYVYNFKETDKPKSLKLSPGRGKELKKDMAEFIDTLQAKIPEVFDSDDYRAKESEVHQSFEKRRREIIDELSEKAKEEGFVLQFSQVGMVIIPANKEGEPMTQEDLRQLEEEERKKLREKSDELHDKMKDAIKQIREAEAEFKEKHTKLDNEIALFVVGQLMDSYEEKYKEEEHVLNYLKMVQEDILENIDDFKKKPEAQQQPGAPFPMPQKEVNLRKYEVNVLIDNSETEGAPVVIESNPAYPNLFGTIERQAWFGALFTDHTMVKPGALHKANGGYLVMKALDLLKWYLSWEALKRALRDKEIRIEDLGELYGIFSTRTIRPEPIPINLKIVLTGDPYIYQLLYTYDDRFQKLFKVKAHMDNQMDSKEENILESARMMGAFCRDHNLRHMDKTGVARVLEYSMQVTEDREKLTLELGDISDLIKEANYFAGLENSQFIQKQHVENAIQKRIYRSNLIEERIKELIEKDIFWIETDGHKVGQLNGLSVLMTGDHEFGKPNRITATVSVGREGVVAIERESKMSGNIHTKGVMILSSFLKERFAHNKPISLTASLTFEQSYGMVDGDSASSTELYALLSAISGVPIYQGIAVTGSVSQKGEIQPIGGAVHKIKAFFDICKHKGLNGKQGVMIPSKNIRNVVLQEEVVEAVREGRFHIWPVSTIEEGIEILTGMEAGVLQEDGSYPEGTLFRKVDDRLREIAEIVKEYGKGLEGGGRREEEGGGCPTCGGK
ncbi:Lon protease family protein [Desulfoferrobacter suflitae]|uniref:Lon protease family protein n=1 Tax=Desulfoferrobacter suflitae TaxID=2865782 RepID=UPI002164289C|nr:AAA family ATPase [Desulfoferrobacter suflitae]MCK8602818.1 AAA family ATPase [Desulfoferrobacter suflitae]